MLRDPGLPKSVNDDNVVEPELATPWSMAEHERCSATALQSFLMPEHLRPRVKHDEYTHEGILPHHQPRHRGRASCSSSAPSGGVLPPPLLREDENRQGAGAVHGLWPRDGEEGRRSTMGGGIVLRQRRIRCGVFSKIVPPGHQQRLRVR
jgi:hypothetical protein